MPLSVVAAAGAVCNFDPILNLFCGRGLLHAVVFLCIIFSQFARCGRQPPASAIWGSTWRRIFRPTRHPGTMPGRSLRPPRSCVSGRSPCGTPPRVPCRSTTCAHRRTPPRRSGVRILPGVVRGVLPLGVADGQRIVAILRHGHLVELEPVVRTIADVATMRLFEALLSALAWHCR